ncbi:type I restriction endonuclease subunit R [Thiothrix nivea]|uniref:Restriction endonuclease, type I, EcoRI, R subunit/Type III n=1 Tax=Thiothrix nivea (strain ATCC 35100 / DSM 5205 / JP2) TaxID=870187 RepID=A0A656HE17_THINJ|nr:type I restriction endonuclease [Thiothrix nivea]EIJ34432.1 Restriction endonuclease, type I, EcoRI, R subunit/Type III [Thiothrix nivea DSM 5205]
MNITSENTFETAIVASLLESGGYIAGDASEFSAELGMFKAEVLQFLQTTQAKQWDRLSAIHGEDISNRIIARLYKEMDLRGALDVIRNGFVDYGVRFKMAFFKPESGLNPDTLAMYEQNQLKVTRQVYYSKKNKNSVDLVLSLNGLPVATLELKNRFTGQNITHAKRQYATSRDHRELLFAFKKRALVHFAVDDEEVYMATRIDGDRTYWLPFNKGHNNGAGNPPNPAGYRSDYLWRDILAKDSWLEIIGRFIHLQVEEFEFEGYTRKKEKLIFPRFHQLDAVRKITHHAQTNGAGHNYLVQHSAGSGKSNSIAWLSYRLSGLHNDANQRIFDSVIVVTDRRVLDSQLQNTIYQFEHKSGVVQRIDKDSQQLADAIEGGANIIITTLQKFPFVIDKVGGLANRRYAVIIDEAHSSQGGEASKKMKQVLGDNATSVQEPYPKYGEGDGEEVMDSQDMVSDYIEQIDQSAAARGRQANLSFFAFTATPKYKTLAVFGYKDVEGKPQPFHLYSMRQAIEEGFILDVLQHYTTYQLYFKLCKAIEDDPKINRKKAAQAIGRFVSLHPHNLAQKTEIIIEHFRQVVAAKIGGRAKAMLVTGSRLHAKRYFEEFKRYIKLKGYGQHIKILVAFSGKVVDDNFPEGVTEPQLTGFGEKELPQKFADDEYKILIVADKYQTGFDQPLLHTMYVDKPLSGVKAVQTLSRLNRTAPGKEDTFILDFVNERQTILDSFQPYYELTTVTDEPEPNHLYDLKAKLDGQQIYLMSEVDVLARVYFDPTTQMTPRTQAQLYSYIDPAVDRYKAIDSEDSQDEFKKSLRTWTNLYAFMAQIMPFREPEFEKFYAYAKLLLTKLPKRDLAESMKLSDEVALEYYRLEKIKEGSIDLITGEDGELDGLTEAGIKCTKDEKIALSEIIDVLNERFGTEFEEADRLFFEQIETELMQDATLKVQARVNKLDTFKYAFEELFIDKLIERMDQNQEIFEKILEDQSFGGLVKELMMKKIYGRLNERDS